MFRGNNKPIRVTQNSYWEEEFQLRRLDYAPQSVDPDRLSGYLSKSFQHGVNVSVPLQFYVVDETDGRFKAFLPADVTANLFDQPYVYSISYAVTNEERHLVASGNCTIELGMVLHQAEDPTPTENTVFYFPVPTTTWVADHQLAAYPTVVCFDQFNNKIEGSVEYNSDRVLTVTFLLPVSGVLKLVR